MAGRHLRRPSLQPMRTSGEHRRGTGAFFDTSIHVSTHVLVSWLAVVLFGALAATVPARTVLVFLSFGHLVL